MESLAVSIFTHTTLSKKLEKNTTMKTRKSPLQLLHTPRPKIGSPILLSGQNGITHLAHFKKILKQTDVSGQLFV